MDTNEKTYYTVRYLLSKSLEGTASAEDIQLLDTTIIQSEEARRYYVELLHMHVTLRKLLEKAPVSINAEEDGILDVQLWEELARHEQVAESIVVEREDSDSEEDFIAAQQPVTATGPKLSRLSWMGVITSIAAALLVVLYLQLVPVPKPIVATLTDSIGAQWAKSVQPLMIGDDVRAESCHLLSGVVSLTFESGAEVVIEGPAEYQPISANEMRLVSGKAFARVPKTAIGFTVNTPESSVVDLGTEFGVVVDLVSGSEIHVFKGKVNLVAGFDLQPKKSEILQQHQARQVDAEKGVIRPTEFAEYLFAQKISSAENRIDYGKGMYVSLADLVMGGNGYGMSQENSLIYSVSTGQQITDPTGEYRTINNPYQQVSSNIFIDGIFVPNGSNQVISSEGDVFAECPGTTGLYYYNLCFDKNSNYASPVAQRYQQQRNLDFSPDVVFMHSNIGVTFNLDAVRRQFPNRSIRRFRTTVGTLSFFGGFEVVSSEMLTLDYTEFDVWIVVDGQLRSKERVHWDSLIDLDVSLTPEDRFLSILVTDGGGIRCPGNNENHYDLCGLADMRFEMKFKE